MKSRRSSATSRRKARAAWTLARPNTFTSDLSNSVPWGSPENSRGGSAVHANCELAAAESAVPRVSMAHEHYALLYRLASRTEGETRVEVEIMRASAPAMASLLGPRCAIIEFGSGSSQYANHGRPRWKMG